MSNATRDRILNAALLLFNTEGVQKTSLNRIATETGISAGNLHYHFKTKEQIEEWLLRRFEHRVEAITAARKVAALDDLWLILHLALEAIQEFGFVYRDLDRLARSSPCIARRLQRITERLVTTTRRMCESLAEEGVMHIAREDLDALALQMVFTATCWHSFAQLLPERASHEDRAGQGAYQVLTLLAPYLDKHARLYLQYLRSKYLT
jgi:AcrR family transcriptional regulator